MRAAVGTKEGALAIVDAGSGEVEDKDLEAHGGEVWTVAATREGGVSWSTRRR